MRKTLVEMESCALLPKAKKVKCCAKKKSVGNKMLRGIAGLLISRSVDKS